MQQSFQFACIKEGIGGKLCALMLVAMIAVSALPMASVLILDAAGESSCM